MNRQTLNILVGAAVVILGAAVILYSYRITPINAPEGYKLTARFSSIDGVTVGTRVLLAGIKVGEVTDQGFDTETQRARVTLTIDKDVRIPTDSVAKIVSEGMLGARYIKLQAGGAEQMFAPGGEFEYVQGSINFEEILQKIIQNAEAARQRNGEGGDSERREKSTLGSTRNQ